MKTYLQAIQAIKKIIRKTGKYKSHSCCNEQSGEPACGIAKESHYICCLCGEVIKK